MRYTLFMYWPEAAADTLSEEALAAGREAMGSYASTLHAAGVLISGEVLQPSPSSTTLRLADGAVAIQDGPFADTKEQLGGTFVIDAPDLDAALGWAKQAPPLHWGAVEVRPGAVHVTGGAWVPNQ